MRKRAGIFTISLLNSAGYKKALVDD